MNKKLCIGTVFLISTLYSAQTELSFEYDESGNQIFRGVRSDNNENTTTSSQDLINSIESGVSLEELAFWNEIKIGPNPVKDRLTIQFLGNIKENIQKISLYGQSSLGRELYTKDIFLVKGDREEIDMTAYLFGNYTISFHLKNGKVYSKHILKH